MPKPFVYGKSPVPKSWQEVADQLKANKPRASLTDWLTKIEQMLKEK